MYKLVDTFSSKYNGDVISSSKHRFYILGSPLFPILLHQCVCVLGLSKPVDSVHTFPSGYDTLEYSWVKATAVSVRLRILFVTLQNTNKLSGAVAGERQLHYLRTQSFSYLFPFLSFYLYPRYPWSSYPFNSSLHPRASSMSQHLPLIQFFPPAMNSVQAL